VAVFHRRPNKHEAGVLEQIQGDRDRLPQYRGDIARFAPEVVVDLILSSGHQAKQLIDVMRGIARRVVGISSMDVYRAWGVIHGVEHGPLEPLPRTEGSARRMPRQPYPPAPLIVMPALPSRLHVHPAKPS